MEGKSLLRKRGSINARKSWGIACRGLVVLLLSGPIKMGIMIISSDHFKGVEQTLLWRIEALRQRFKI
jgi:hypothetical protein